MDTLASKISNETLDKIIQKFNFKEVKGTAGGDFLPLTAPKFGDIPVGGLRVWDGGEQLGKMVYIGITVEAIGMDSHMIFAFSKPDSLLPNFTLDSVFTQMPPGADPSLPEGGPMYSFHLDLIPSVDLGINYEYMKRCFIPLTKMQDECRAHEGIRQAMLSSAQNAIMSPWMLAQRCTPEAYTDVVFKSADFYLQHWFKMFDEGLDDLADGIISVDPALRERENRALIFSRELDPVWAKIDMMVGEETSNYMISVLRNQEIEQPR